MKNENINISKIRSKRIWAGWASSEPAYDVRTIGHQLDLYTFELDGFDDSGVLYIDSGTLRRIQSIGVRHSDGKIIASLLPDLYEHPDYKCVWLI